MTFDNDPNRSDRNGLGQARFGRRADGSWNVLPLVLGALAVGFAGYLLFGDNFRGPDRARTGVSDTTNSPGTTKTPIETNK